MKRLRPSAIDEGAPRNALRVYSNASQSPMNGSTRIKPRIRDSTVGGNHQRQRQKPDREGGCRGNPAVSAPSLTVGFLHFPDVSPFSTACPVHCTQPHP